MQIPVRGRWRGGEGDHDEDDVDETTWRGDDGGGGRFMEQAGSDKFGSGASTERRANLAKYPYRGMRHSEMG